MKSASWPPKRSGGFTLIEVLAAVSISAVVLTLLYGSFFQLLDSRDRVEAKNEAAGEAAAVLSRIRSDLANAFARGRVSPLASSAYPHDYFVATTEDGNSSLSFTSFQGGALHHSARSGQSEISYYVVALREEPRRLFALVRRDNRRIGDDGAGKALSRFGEGPGLQGESSHAKLPRRPESREGAGVEFLGHREFPQGGGGGDSVRARRRARGDPLGARRRAGGRIDEREGFARGPGRAGRDSAGDGRHHHRRALGGRRRFHVLDPGELRDRRQRSEGRAGEAHGEVRGEGDARRDEVRGAGKHPPGRRGPLPHRGPQRGRRGGSFPFPRSPWGTARCRSP